MDSSSLSVGIFVIFLYDRYPNTPIAQYPGHNLWSRRVITSVHDFPSCLGEYIVVSMVTLPQPTMAQRRLAHAQRRALPSQMNHGLPPKPYVVAPPKRNNLQRGASYAVDPKFRIQRPRMNTRSSPSRNMALGEGEEDEHPAGHPLCNWSCVGLCLVAGAPITLLRCSVASCDNHLHHMCQTTWESEDPVRESHGNSYYCMECHPLSPRGAAPRGVAHNAPPRY